MNRRSFFRAIAKGVLAAAATCYAPRLLKAPVPESEPLNSPWFSLTLKTEEYATPAVQAWLNAVSKKLEPHVRELMLYGRTTLPNGTVMRNQNPSLGEVYGVSPGAGALEDLWTPQ